ncbi:LysM peptidoglycan-binding domain-containing protein [Rossellomorea vietnamensis]|uniref:LysM peptidoglycan-binding domain-containing protein n=1 Tax=Rossellomorea vietnamensis TaxID=218284 RepID=A0A5D4KDT8_9BACI|nr:M14 family zinc carboxypeptidase [Rossellomorea vietnamensis]TYR75531.1 LysM peptidoglycan-binding domain-containing protein [Rossellomorea vietnamensis]
MEVQVRRGDTFYYYSQLFYLPLQLIIDSNSDMAGNSLQIGQTVSIPGFYIGNYTIRQGDTFWGIARRRNLSVDALLLLNQSLNPSALQVGAEISIPLRITQPVVMGQQAYSFGILDRDIKSLKNAFPFIKVSQIGESVLGKPLYEILIGNGEKKVHINASFHANEWITTPILMRFMNDYLLSLTNRGAIRGVVMEPLYSSVTLSLVPMVNPDGVDLVIEGPPPALREELIEFNKGNTNFSGWKANINGVDLNNQYPAKWELEKERKEEKNPAPRDFPGYKPLSEPEAIAMAELARSGDLDRVLALHTQGEEFYWGFEGMEPPESEMLAEEFERVSGYRSVRYIDSFAGYKDWFIQEFQRPGFTVELGMGINPLPLSQFDRIYESVLGIFLVSIYR